MATVVTGTQSIRLLPNEPKVIGNDFQFDDLVKAGATLSGTPAVTVINKTTGLAPGGELTIGSPTISGSQVTFLVTPNAAIPGTLYQCDVRCPTSQAGQYVEAIRMLEIIGEG